MKVAEIPTNGAAAATAQGPDPGRAARQAAARYLDAWEANQAEIARLGPPRP